MGDATGGEDVSVNSREQTAEASCAPTHSSIMFYRAPGWDPAAMVLLAADTHTVDLPPFCDAKTNKQPWTVLQAPGSAALTCGQFHNRPRFDVMCVASPVPEREEFGKFVSPATTF